ncbi:hypothetical protein [Persephonella sp.]|uniref:hypothetical protein n=1 Tax=Persephonella sp. TaxID=2060922 RepID=UPI0025E3CB06|nr:hypothetical protein [Persephonella sp.]
MRIYFFAFSVLLFQMAVFPKLLSFQSMIPDFLTIFIILFTLKNELYKSLKMASFIGILQDLLSPSGLLFNTATKISISIIVYIVKDRFYYSNIFMKSFFIVFFSLLDIFSKSLLLYFKTGIFELPPFSIFYILINLIIFYSAASKYEYR